MGCSLCGGGWKLHVLGRQRDRPYRSNSGRGYYSSDLDSRYRET